MIPLVDGDIIRYEIGFAAEAGWRYMHEGEDDVGLPDWAFVENVLNLRLDTICEDVGATQEPILYLSEGSNFRFDIATTKPYKGTRPSNKPWHYDNLTVHLKDVLGVKLITKIEADDALCIDHLADPEQPTILCSRDKDLRQCPGWFYSWELGKQAGLGPLDIDKIGYLELKPNGKIMGTGLKYF